MFKIQNFKFSDRLGVVAPHARALPARPRHRTHAWYTWVRVGGAHAPTPKHPHIHELELRAIVAAYV